MEGVRYEVQRGREGFGEKLSAENGIGGYCSVTLYGKIRIL